MEEPFGGGGKAVESFSAAKRSGGGEYLGVDQESHDAGKVDDIRGRGVDTGGDLGQGDWPAMRVYDIGNAELHSTFQGHGVCEGEHVTPYFCLALQHELCFIVVLGSAHHFLLLFQGDSPLVNLSINNLHVARGSGEI